jgi:hypothetical protein
VNNYEVVSIGRNKNFMQFYTSSLGNSAPTSLDIIDVIYNKSETVTDEQTEDSRLEIEMDSNFLSRRPFMNLARNRPVKVFLPNWGEITLG